jgi:Fe-S oxidoreductase
MGAEIVEMKHSHRRSICCGASVEATNPVRAAEIAEKRVNEAKETGADTLVIGCAGCFSMYGKAKEHGLETYHILEMAQMAIGEKPVHRIEEVKSQLVNNMIKAVSENPEVLKQKYIIKNGKITAL